MKKRALAIGMLLCLTAAAENWLTEDLDRDGRPERLEWRPFQQTEGAIFYQLFLYDDDGKLLWSGPKTTKEESPFFVAEMDEGVSTPELMADIDGDGKTEILIPLPQCDVSPTYYHRLRWTGKVLHPLPTAVLEYFQTPEDAGLRWRETIVEDRSCWVLDMKKDHMGLLRAFITGYCITPGVLYRGEAIINFAPGGGRVVGWTQSFEPVASTGEEFPSGDSAESASGVFPYSLPSYRARLSRRDHYNSRGIRLKSINAILRQDRANLYRYGGDPEDRPDAFFRTVRERSRMEHFAVRPLGVTPEEAQRIIRYGTPLVDVYVGEGVLYLRIVP